MAENFLWSDGSDVPRVESSSSLGPGAQGPWTSSPGQDGDKQQQHGVEQYRAEQYRAGHWSRHRRTCCTTPAGCYMQPPLLPSLRQTSSYMFPLSSRGPISEVSLSGSQRKVDDSCRVDLQTQRDFDSCGVNSLTRHISEFPQTPLDSESPQT